MSNILTVLTVLAVMWLTFAASYALALAGEPQSRWIWCTVLGLCP